MRKILVYDGSFDGFLTAIFDVYDEKLTDVTIQPKHRSTQNFFDTSSEVVTDEKKAHRVWEGISKACSKTGKTNIYRAFLSELDGIEDTLFHFIKRSLAERVDVAKDYGDAEILKISKVDLISSLLFGVRKKKKLKVCTRRDLFISEVFRADRVDRGTILL